MTRQRVGWAVIYLLALVVVTGMAFLIHYAITILSHL